MIQILVSFQMYLYDAPVFSILVSELTIQKKSMYKILEIRQREFRQLIVTNERYHLHVYVLVSKFQSDLHFYVTLRRSSKKNWDE